MSWFWPSRTTEKILDNLQKPTYTYGPTFTNTQTTTTVMVNGKDWHAVSCAECGTEFIVRKALYEIVKRHNRDIFCPNGHKIHLKPKTP